MSFCLLFLYYVHNPSQNTQPCHNCSTGSSFPDLADNAATRALKSSTCCSIVLYRSLSTFALTSDTFTFDLLSNSNSISSLLFQSLPVLFSGHAYETFDRFPELHQGIYSKRHLHALLHCISDTLFAPSVSTQPRKLQCYPLLLFFTYPNSARKASRKVVDEYASENLVFIFSKSPCSASVKDEYIANGASVNIVGKKRTLSTFVEACSLLQASNLLIHSSNSSPCFSLNVGAGWRKTQSDHCLSFYFEADPVRLSSAAF